MKIQLRVVFIFLTLYAFGKRYRRMLQIAALAPELHGRVPCTQALQLGGCPAHWPNCWEGAMHTGPTDGRVPSILAP